MHVVVFCEELRTGVNTIYVQACTRICLEKILEAKSAATKVEDG